MQYILKKLVHSCFAGISSSDVWLEKVIDIEGTLVHKGLVIQLGEDTMNETVEEILYNTVNKKCYLYTEDDKTFYDKGLHEGAAKHYNETKEFKDLIIRYEMYGWEVVK